MDESQITTQSTEEAGDPGVLIGRALRVVSKWKLAILLTGLVTLLAAAVALSFVPNVYRSDASILVVEQQIPQSMVAPLSNVAGTQKLQALTQEVLSRASLLKIIDDTHLFGNQKLPPDLAVERMRKSIIITPDGVTREGSFNAFIISFSASSPGLAQEVTRRLSSLFIERHSETQANRANSTSGFLKDRLTEKRKRATELEQQIKDFRMRFAGELPESRLANETRMAELRAQLQNTLSGLNRAKQQRVVSESAVSAHLNGTLARLKGERTALLERLTPKHPQVIAKDEEIVQMERAVASLRAGSLSQEQLRLVSSDPAVGQLQGQIEASRLEIETFSRDQQRHEEMLNGLQRRVNLTPALEQQLAGMTRESEFMNQEIAKLDAMDQQSALSADMERRQQGEQFRQLDSPSLPLRPVSPARVKLSLGAAAVGCGLAFIVAFLADMRRACFYTEQELRRRFGPPLVLGIPELPTQGELRKQRWRAVTQWTAGAFALAAMAAIELYIYRHP